MTTRIFHFSGKVVRGQGRGRDLGFPTANISVSQDMVEKLPQGVFAVMVEDVPNRPIEGLANIGIKPTFGGEALTVELHLLDFEGDLYGRNLNIVLLDKLREERAFSDPVDLVAQIRKDIHQARVLFENKGRNAQQLTTEVEGVDND